MKDPEVNPKFEALLEYIKNTRTVDFTGYKRSSLLRRISKRMAQVGIDDFVEYFDFLEVHQDEFNELLNTILINVTSFFRDAALWQYLEKTVIPSIIKSKEKDEPIRVWSAGCASGEEPYSLLMLFAEKLGLDQIKRLKIYATDIDEEALSHARSALYNTKSIENVPEKLRDKYFTRENSHYSFKLDARKTVIFGRHDIVRDAPISKLDLLVCRNTLMYLNNETQKSILQRFHFALKDTGYLFLGKAELMLTQSDLFEPENVKSRVFQKRVHDNQHRYMKVINSSNSSDELISKVLQLRETSFDTSQIPELVVDKAGKLLLVNQRAQALLGLDNSKFGLPFQDLEISYRPVELRSVIERCYKTGKSETTEPVEFKNKDGTHSYFEISVVPLFFNHSAIGSSITFFDVSEAFELKKSFISANQELETSNEELQSAQEELQTTNEELQSTNEELETTNEELQSTNEELETMNEELQSTNEELETLNSDLLELSNTVSTSHKFLQSILSSMDSAVIAVNSEFEILLWNHKSFELWGLKSDEVKNKSFLGLDIGFPIKKFQKAVNSILSGAEESCHFSVNATNRRGKQISCSVRLTQLSQDRDGVVIMINDSSMATNLQK